MYCQNAKYPESNSGQHYYIVIGIQKITSKYPVKNGYPDYKNIEQWQPWFLFKAKPQFEIWIKNIDEQEGNYFEYHLNIEE